MAEAADQLVDSSATGPGEGADSQWTKLRIEEEDDQAETSVAVDSVTPMVPNAGKQSKFMSLLTEASAASSTEIHALQASSVHCVDLEELD